MKLTDMQKDILRHRLEVPDCIGECVGEIFGVDSDSVESSVDSVAARIESGIWIDLSPMEKEVLIDCVDGSTWLTSMMDGSDKDDRQFGPMRSAVSLAKKVSALVGREILFPTY